MHRKALILLSRQPLRPHGQTGWVDHTKQAILFARARGLEIVSSAGMQTWEMITALASHLGARQKILLPVSTEEEFEAACERLRHDFALKESLVRFEAVVGDSRRDLMSVRDARAFELADILIPVAVRKSGSMARRLRAIGAQKEVIHNFQCVKNETSDSFGYHASKARLNPEVMRVGCDWLFHWTRAVNTAWPGERLIDYYSDIVNSESYPRSAFETLRHIVRERKLIASSRHIPHNTPCVCFSGLKPADVVPLMRWRARYAQMSFEPYAIGIERKTALSLGIQQVLYYNGKPTDEVPIWLTQSRGKITDWTREDEYRCKGDLDFSDLPDDKLLLICRYPHEAKRLEEETGIRAVGMFESPTSTASFFVTQ